MNLRVVRVVQIACMKYMDCLASAKASACDGNAAAVTEIHPKVRESEASETVSCDCSARVPLRNHNIIQHHMGVSINGGTIKIDGLYKKTNRKYLKWMRTGGVPL